MLDLRFVVSVETFDPAFALRRDFRAQVPARGWTKQLLSVATVPPLIERRGSCGGASGRG
jgi:hypothetical protein